MKKIFEDIKNTDIELEVFQTKNSTIEMWIEDKHEDYPRDICIELSPDEAILLVKELSKLIKLINGK